MGVSEGSYPVVLWDRSRSDSARNKRGGGANGLGLEDQDHVGLLYIVALRVIVVFKRSYDEQLKLTYLSQPHRVRIMTHSHPTRHKPRSEPMNRN